MSITNTARKAMVAGATLAAITLGGVVGASSALADHRGPNASENKPAGQQHARIQEEPLVGATADKVKAAVLAAYPDATIDRMEKDAGGGAVYEAHITKGDGTRTTVLLDAGFTVTGEATKPAGIRDGHRGHRGHHGQPSTPPAAGQSRA